MFNLDGMFCWQTANSAQCSADMNELLIVFLWVKKETIKKIKTASEKDCVSYIWCGGEPGIAFRSYEAGAFSSRGDWRMYLPSSGEWMMETVTCCLHSSLSFALLPPSPTLEIHHSCVVQTVRPTKTERTCPAEQGERNLHPAVSTPQNELFCPPLCVLWWMM